MHPAHSRERLLLRWVRDEGRPLARITERRAAAVHLALRAEVVGNVRDSGSDLRPFEIRQRRRASKASSFRQASRCRWIRRR